MMYQTSKRVKKLSPEAQYRLDHPYCVWPRRQRRAKEKPKTRPPECLEIRLIDGERLHHESELAELWNSARPMNIQVSCDGGMNGRYWPLYVIDRLIGKGNIAVVTRDGELDRVIYLGRDEDAFVSHWANLGALGAQAMRVQEQRILSKTICMACKTEQQTADVLGGLCDSCRGKRSKNLAEINQDIRRIRELSAIGEHSEAEWLALLDSCGRCCMRCGSERHLSRDHIQPISKGGTHFIDNIQVLCVPCNSWKGAKEIDFRPETMRLSQQFK